MEFNELKEKLNQVLEKDKKNRKCLLIAEKDDNFYISISGFNLDESYSLKVNKIYNELINALKEYKINNIIQCERLSIVMSEFYVIKNNKIQKNILTMLEAYIKGIYYTKRDFSCCEKKLLAKLNNDLASFKSLKYIICRYDPCEKCYWLMKGFPKLFIIRSDEIYHFTIPSNLNCLFCCDNYLFNYYLSRNFKCNHGYIYYEEPYL